METPAPLCTRGLVGDQKAKPDVILTKQQSAKCPPGSKADLNSPSGPLLSVDPRTLVMSGSASSPQRWVRPYIGCSTCNLASKPVEEAASGWGNGKGNLASPMVGFIPLFVGFNPLFFGFFPLFLGVAEFVLCILRYQ